MNNKKVLIINGHPDKESFNFGLMDAYKQGVLKSENEMESIVVGELNFNPDLQFAYRKRTELEPDLLVAWKKIEWADHIVWIYPLWWGFMPAILKGFIDRLFLPGFAFQSIENSIRIKKLLTHKTAHIINTMDYPVWYYKWLLREPGTKLMKYLILQFVGIKNIRTTYIGPIKGSSEDFRAKWIDKLQKFGDNF
ncbi:NAD(P)H-dependent oxidoreductase [Spirochaeta dissipatitropha]